MKKYRLLFTNIIICFVIIVGFLTMNLISKHSQNKLLHSHIENISNLASLNVSSQIVNTFAESVHVSQTMSHDTFLAEWLRTEGTKPSKEKISEITKYLNAYKTNNNYNTVFLVSQNTLNYYYFNGINKVIDPNDGHDIWFKNFVDSGESYRLEVDYDQVNSDHITLFVNCRIEDEHNNFVGVVGVGLQIDKIQSLLIQHEKDYNLQAYLVDEKGFIRIRSNITDIISENYFDNLANPTMVSKILSNKTSPEIQWSNSNSLDKCTITQYIKDFEWYLVIEKDNREVKEAFASQFRNSVFVIIIITILILLLVTGIIKKYDQIVRKMASSDQLTNLQNRETFYTNFEKIKQKSEYKNGTLFIFDIDNFKNVNDQFGHIYGDEILKYVAKIAQDDLKENGILARWGGDEFVGMLKENENNKAILESLVTHLAQDKNEFNHSIGISVGTAHMSEHADIKELVICADRAMYQAKASGKGKVC